MRCAVEPPVGDLRGIGPSSRSSSSRLRPRFRTSDNSAARYPQQPFERAVPPGSLTHHQRQYWAWVLQRKAASGSVESLASTLVDAQVDLNPHQVEAALFACQNPLSKGVILADEWLEDDELAARRHEERLRRVRPPEHPPREGENLPPPSPPAAKVAEVIIGLKIIIPIKVIANDTVNVKLFESKIFSLMA